MLFGAEKLSGLYHEVPSRSDLHQIFTLSPGTLGSLLACAEMKRTVPTPYGNGIQVSLLDGQGLPNVFIQNGSQGANLPRVGQTLGTWDPSLSL